MRIVFLGNHSVPYSTESHFCWTFEKMGHQVTRLQENQASADQVVEACRGAQVFSWSHTHGWRTPGAEMMVARIRDLGVKSFTYHLDYYHGLDTWDKRWSLVGSHPSWHLDYTFLTDGGHEAEFKAKGVDVRYLPPAVVEYGVYEGKPNLAFDVGFAGSVNYHPEYPFRKRMIEELQKHYGPRFRIFQGIREQALNDLYASGKVWVGDHCFSGTPRYWSDRLPETCGRGGFIVYPQTEGLTIPVATYKPQSIDSLIIEIDAYLIADTVREKIRKECMEHVRNNDTYTHRLLEILRVMGFEDQHLHAGSSAS